MNDSMDDIVLSSQFSCSPKVCENKVDDAFEYTEDEFAHDLDLLIGAEERANKEANLDDGQDSEQVQPNLVDLSKHFTTKKVFYSLDEAQTWIEDRGLEVGVAIKKRRSDYSSFRNPYVLFACEKSGTADSHVKGGVYKKKVGGTGKAKARRTYTNLCNCPFSVKCKMDKSTGLWTLDVKEGTHNHKLFKYEYGHAILGRLTAEEKEAVRRMSKSDIRPKNILKELKENNPRNFTIPKQIYNLLAQFRKKEMEGRSVIQEVFNLAEGSKCFIRHTRNEGRLDNLFWSHNESLLLARNFHHVFMMDCTYKTNQYKMALLQIIGVTSTNKSFCAAFALLSMERETNYIWALEMLKEVLDVSFPSCIVTDKELALMNAVRTVFPETNQLICRWHIERAVESKAMVKCGMEDGKEITEKWVELENSVTEEEFNNNWAIWKEKLNPEMVTYLEKTWINDFKTMFVSAWTDKYFHLGNTCTSRVESVHAVLKNWLGASNINLVTHWHSVENLVQEQIRNIQATFENSTGKTLKEYSGKQWCRYLLGSVSHTAIEIMKKEVDEIDYAILSSEKCSCTLRTTHGLPCLHEMKELLRNGKSVPLSSVHVHWRTLCIEGPFEKKCGELDYRPLVNQFIKKFENSPWDVQFELLERLREVIDPKTTTLQEPPIKIKAKGRPKGSRSKGKDKETKDECSTKREPSYFEHVREMFGEFDGKLSQTAPSSNPKPKSGRKRKAPQCGQALKTSQSSKIVKAPEPRVDPKLEYVPPLLQPYVNEIVDVAKDGNCAFRSIALGLGLGENEWPRIRLELKTHLENNKERYLPVFRDAKKIEDVLYTLDWKAGVCPYEKWILCPYTLWLVSDYYNVGVCAISTLANYTYLPITQGPPEKPKLIWLCNIRGSHYVVPVMKDNCPLPVISHPWQVSCNIDAIKWEVMYEARFKEGERLFFPTGRPPTDFFDLD